MVSKFGHCLNDLLFRARIGALPVEIAAVVSNHTDFAELVASYDIPFHHIPVTRDTKAGGRGAAAGARAGGERRARRAGPLHAGALGRSVQAAERPDHQHPPLLPAELQGREAVPPGARARCEADRRDRALRDRRPRRGADHRAGGRARGARASRRTSSSRSAATWSARRWPAPSSGTPSGASCSTAAVRSSSPSQARSGLQTPAEGGRGEQDVADRLAVPLLARRGFHRQRRGRRPAGRTPPRPARHGRPSWSAEPTAAGESSGMYQSPPPRPSISRCRLAAGRSRGDQVRRAGAASPVRRRSARAAGSSRAARSIMRCRWRGGGRLVGVVHRLGDVPAVHPALEGPVQQRVLQRQREVAVRDGELARRRRRRTTPCGPGRGSGHARARARRGSAGGARPASTPRCARPAAGGSARTVAQRVLQAQRDRRPDRRPPAGARSPRRPSSGGSPARRPRTTAAAPARATRRRRSPAAARRAGRSPRRTAWPTRAPGCAAGAGARQPSRTRVRSDGSRSRLSALCSRPTASRSRSASSAQGAHVAEVFLDGRRLLGGAGGQRPGAEQGLQHVVRGRAGRARRGSGDPEGSGAVSSTEARAVSAVVRVGSEPPGPDRRAACSRSSAAALGPGMRRSTGCSGPSRPSAVRGRRSRRAPYPGGAAPARRPASWAVDEQLEAEAQPAPGLVLGDAEVGGGLAVVAALEVGQLQGGAQRGGHGVDDVVGAGGDRGVPHPALQLLGRLLPPWTSAAVSRACAAAARPGGGSAVATQERSGPCLGS